MGVGERRSKLISETTIFSNNVPFRSAGKEDATICPSLSIRTGRGGSHEGAGKSGERNLVATILLCPFLPNFHQLLWWLEGREQFIDGEGRERPMGE